VNTDTIEITPELLALLSEIDEFKGAWQLLGILAPERLNALRRVATIESIGSSTRIEGSKLTDREVEQLLTKLEIKSFDSRDEQEVAGYAEVMETVFHAYAEIPITENHLKQLHRDLLRYSIKDERHRGEYKTLSNNVGAFDEDGKMIGIVFETASPFDTHRRMAELLNWLKDTREIGRMHPLLLVAVFIVNFLEIHPFQDGNGRLSRILTTLLLLQAGYVYVEWGPEFYARHSACFPNFGGPALTASIGWLGLHHVLQNGGSGYFPIRIVQRRLLEGTLHLVEGAPDFLIPAYAVYPAEHDRDVFDSALEIMRTIADSAVNAGDLRNGESKRS